MNEVALSNFDATGPYNPAVPRPPICAPAWSMGWLAHKVLRPYNRVRHAWLKRNACPSSFRRLAEVRALASSLTDIDEHLELMFVEGLLCRPRLIVELGVRGGTSTAVFERVSDISGGSIISGDIEDCSHVSQYPRWHFLQGDDVKLAKHFPEHCQRLGLSPSIDLLFIDTSHYYDHTAEEIRAWFPLLSPHAKVMFHDTNLRLIGGRRDKCFQLSWDNQRGVIRAIEEFLGVRIDESAPCTEIAAGWLLRHWPNCNGFTILDRIA
jgi:cephalosporin hydroxylase